MCTIGDVLAVGFMRCILCVGGAGGRAGEGMGLVVEIDWVGY